MGQCCWTADVEVDCLLSAATRHVRYLNRNVATHTPLFIVDLKLFNYDQLIVMPIKLSL